jgi:hypothetical protein
MREGLDEQDEERQRLIERIRSGEGTVEEAEGWVRRLREITWWFDSSDRFYYIALGVESRRIEEAIETTLTAPPTRQLLVEWLRKAKDAELPEAEQDAYLNLVVKNVPHPALTDLIYYSDTDYTPEEIIEIALNYQPTA